MSTTASTAAANGQEGSLNPPQPSTAAPTAPAAPDHHPTSIPAAPNIQAIVSSWATASKADQQVVLEAYNRYYKQAGLTDGRTDGTRGKVLYFHFGTSSLPLSVLLQAARSMQVPEQEIPPNTIRHRIYNLPTEIKKSPNTRSNGNNVNEKRTVLTLPVLEGLADHYNGGRALPFIPGVEVPESLSPLVGVVVGTRLVDVKAAKDGLPPSYDFDVSFRDSASMEAALKDPYKYHGKSVPITYSLPPSLRGLVELRTEVKDLSTSDSTICSAFKAALVNPRLKLIRIVKHFEPIQAYPNSAPTYRFGGKVSGFVQVEGIKFDGNGEYRKILSSNLPNSITFGHSLPIPLRHNFELSFCPRCKFSGHEGVSCPRFPCSSCGKADHVATDCRNPTGRNRRIPGLNQQQDQHSLPPRPRDDSTFEPAPTSNKKRALQPQLSAANATPLGTTKKGLVGYENLEDESEAGTETEPEETENELLSSRQEAQTPQSLNPNVVKRRKPAKLSPQPAPATNLFRNDPAQDLLLPLPLPPPPLHPLPHLLQASPSLLQPQLNPFPALSTTVYLQLRPQLRLRRRKTKVKDLKSRWEEKLEKAKVTTKLVVGRLVLE